MELSSLKTSVLKNKAKNGTMNAKAIKDAFVIFSRIKPTNMIFIISPGIR